MLLLDVPYKEKDDARALGARWDDLQRVWTASDDEAAIFQRWLPQCRVHLTTRYDERTLVKNLGGRWDPLMKTWFITPDMNREPFEAQGWLKRALPSVGVSRSDAPREGCCVERDSEGGVE